MSILPPGRMDATLAPPTTTALRRRDRVVLTVLIALAVVGSLLSVFLPEGCGGCERAKRAAGPLPLAQIGVGFYAVLLLWTIRWRAVGWLGRVLALAAGVHGVLFAILAWRQTTCWICIGTGLCPIAATLYLLARRSMPFRTAAVFVVIGILAIGGPIAGFIRHQSHAGQRRALAAVQALLRTLPPPVEGQLRLVLLTRPECHRCEAFKRDILPELLKANPAMVVTEHTADDDVPTPVVLALGRRAYAASGQHPLAEYQQMLAAAASDTPPQLPRGVVVVSP